MQLATNPEPAQGGRILIVEDEPELLEPLEYSLRKAGFETFAAADGLNACRMIRSHPDRQLASIPIIMMTALAAADHKYKGLELGADSYLSKPYAMKEVILQARNLVARRRQQEELRQEAERSRRGEELQSDLQNMIFHELRNHLLVIGGFSDVLSRNRARLDQEQSRSYLEAIRRSSGYLTNLAEEFLMLRKVEAGSLELPRQMVDPAALVGEMSQLFAQAAADQGVALTLCLPPQEGPVGVNASALRVVLANLLDNAIRHSPPAGTVRLSWGLEADRFYLEVQDAGPGIPQSEQARIFERFYRGREQQGESRGSGLGLYIARTLVTSLDGHIELHSEPGLGSRFRVVLPAVVDANPDLDRLPRPCQ